MQKIIFCRPVSSDDSEINFQEVNKLLNQGWEIKSVTQQNCAISGGGQSSYYEQVYGGFAVVLEKSAIEL